MPLMFQHRSDQAHTNLAWVRGVSGAVSSSFHKRAQTNSSLPADCQSSLCLRRMSPATAAALALSLRDTQGKMVMAPMLFITRPGGRCSQGPIGHIKEGWSSIAGCCHRQKTARKQMTSFAACTAWMAFVCLRASCMNYWLQ